MAAAAEGTGAARRLKERRLRWRREWRMVMRAGRRVGNRLAVVYWEAGGERTRVGVGVVGGLGSAVARNRVRRRLREVVRLQVGDLAEGWDVVVLGRAAAAAASWEELQEGLRSLWRRAGLWRGR